MPKPNSNTRGIIKNLNYQLFAESASGGQSPNAENTDQLTARDKLMSAINTATGNQIPQDANTGLSPSELVRNILENSDGDSQAQPVQQQVEPQTQPAETQQDPTQVQQGDTSSDGTADNVPEKRLKDAQAWGTRLSQENAQLRQQLGIVPELQRQLQELQQLIQSPQQPQAQQQTQQEDLTKLDPQTALDKFYENPIALMQQIANSQQQQPSINPEILSYVEEQMIKDRWNKEFENIQQMPDFKDNEGAILQYINENNLAYKKGLDPASVFKDAYLYARKMNYQPPQPQPDSKSYLSDPNFQNEILNNPDIVNMIIKAQAQKMQEGTPPVSIASTGSSQPIANITEKPTTKEGWSKRATSILMGNNG